MKVAILHDYFPVWGGAEQVVAAWAEMWPEAPIYTAYYNPSLNYPFSSSRWRAGWQALSFLKKALAPAIPWYFESLDLREYDVVLSSGYFSKAALTLPGQVHLNYCHTPPRFLYHLPSSVSWIGWGGIVASPFFCQLRVWDYVTAQRPDVIVSNSETVRERIKKWWGRESPVIYPPVDLNIQRNSSDLSEKRSGYFLVVSRLEKYKNVGPIVEACNDLELPLKIAGTGSGKLTLRSLAGPTVEVLGWVSSDQLAALYRGCRALVVAAEEEDFGITALEAQAYGKPVIALYSGGFRETIIDNQTGLFFGRPSVPSIKHALIRFESVKFEPTACYDNAAKFSKDRFKKEFRSLVNNNIV